MEIELERTYLLKAIPRDLHKCKSIEILDIYIPGSHPHPVLRARRRGGAFEITKKQPVVLEDSSRQSEQTIPLSEEEFLDFAKLPGKRVRKARYYFPFDGVHYAEIDVFQDQLLGLVMADFEFKTLEEKESFVMPEFCLAEVTEEKFAAGGVLSGKAYRDVETVLEKYGYKKLFLNNEK